MKDTNDKKYKGMIIKGIGGFYYVEVDGEIYECRGRGALRGHAEGAERITPLAGDRCMITVHTDGIASLDEILERKNYLMRPPLANLDNLFIVVSMCDPAPNTLVIDRMISLAEYKEINPIIVLTKLDMAQDSGLGDIYRSAGFTVIEARYDHPDEFIEEIQHIMRDRISGFAGNTGVGKSTLLNAVCPQLKRETGETSKKLGRGRHTTRETELFSLPFGGKIADTPGFSSFTGEFSECVYKEDLPYAFREFSDYIGQCKFTGCAHICEKGCAVLEAVENGEISELRHSSYVTLYNEVKDIKDWERKKPRRQR